MPAGLVKRIGLFGGPAVLACCLLFPLGLADRPRYAAGVAALMAIWWLTEAVNIYVTSLVPLLAFPLLGVFGPGWRVNVHETVRPYYDEYILLFLGGMCIAGAMEQWHLHKRIALHIIRSVGARGDRLLLGFLLATTFISLWISNTATAVMMLPIGLAVLKQLESRSGGGRLTGFGAAIMLAIAYGANVGGIGTKIGTAPNAIFSGFVESRLHRTISFLDWMAIGLPFVAMFLPVTYGLLRWTARDDLAAVGHGEETIARELAALGPTKSQEWAVLLVFAGAALLWIFGQPVSAALGLKSKLYEACVSLGAALVLFAAGLLSARLAARIPWQTLLLLGGGFSMAAGIEGSGLSTVMSDSLKGLQAWPPMLQILFATSMSVAVSAVASNVATINVMLPILNGVSAGSIPMLAGATIACSCDFALPAGTPPNAIVFGSGYLTVRRMAGVGIVLDLLAAVIAAAWVHFGVRLWLP